MATYRFQTNIHADFDPDEPDITVDFVATKGERQTHDSPGSPPTVEIERMYMHGHEMFIPDGMLPFLEDEAWQYLERLEQ